MASGRANRSSSAKTLLLQLHPLEDRLDHDVGFGEPLVRQGRLDHRQAVGHLLGRQPALPDGGLIVLADSGQSAVERLLVDLLEQDRDAGVGVDHRDAAPHGPRADNGRPLDGQDRGLLGDAGDLGHFPFAEEDVDQRLRLVREQAFAEQLGLFLQALGKGQGGRRRDGLDGFQRRQQVAARPSTRGTHFHQLHVVGHLIAELLCELARPAEELAAGQDLARKAGRLLEQVSRDDPVEDARVACLGRGDGIAAGAHLRRPGHACQPRQPLRAAGSRNEPELDFRLTDLRRRHPDAIVTRHGQLEPAAKGETVDGTDDRLGKLLEGFEQTRNR